MHIFLAHIIVLDQTVPLRHWHDWMFRNYCSVGVLRDAVAKLMLLVRYKLVVPGELVERNLAVIFPKCEHLEKDDCSEWVPLQTDASTDMGSPGNSLSSSSSNALLRLHELPQTQSRARTLSVDAL